MTSDLALDRREGAPPLPEEEPPLAELPLPAEDPLPLEGDCAGEVPAGASSYSIDFTCAIGIVCFVVSSAVKVISLAEVEVTVPDSVDPSRISTVACCPEPIWLPHDARKKLDTKKKVPSVRTKMFRCTNFRVLLRSPETVNCALFTITSIKVHSSLRLDLKS